jgi:hypothetical protein
MTLWYRVPVWRLTPHPAYHQCSGNDCRYANSSYHCYQPEAGTADRQAGLVSWCAAVPSQALSVNQTFLPPTPMFALSLTRPGTDDVLMSQVGDMY